MRAVRDGAFADHALSEAAAQLDSRDRAWTLELVYGALRLRARLDHHLAAHSSRKLASLDPDVLDVLRLGAYQLLEMDGVPPYAAVSQSVELARRSAPQAAGFVNAVLQSLRRADGSSTFPSFEQDAVAHLCTWGSHPQWLVKRWIARYGAAAALQLIEQNNQRPPLYLRALGPVADVCTSLHAAGIEVTDVAEVPGSLRMEQGNTTAALDAAAVIVQDPAAALVTEAAAEPAARVVDLAAAPGGKALALALADGAPRHVVAADASAERLRRLRENIARLQRFVAVPVTPLVADGRKPPLAPGSEPFVLLDAPCTGTGTLRRHPDGRWRLEAADLTKLAALQRALLDAAAALVAPNGLLVYSTCSLEPEENEMQVQAFLQRHPSFQLEPVTSVAARFVAAGMLHVTPHQHGFDGAFAARLRRRS
jgi:16S rRNA (cytosine967-C5)-methyltransferase